MHRPKPSAKHVRHSTPRHAAAIERSITVMTLVSLELNNMTIRHDRMSFTMNTIGLDFGPSGSYWLYFRYNRSAGNTNESRTKRP
ncbi:hypothetical protein IF1G_05073 [Cordyceps javanica]|uniref:Uncharacterized protein n=1 Tax=Cordyceps javanica TaxID=43265 RepID=A0A545V449_9HYPO|nr:hypothetical protein IF1G_05073 [Cordyceps javanica]